MLFRFERAEFAALETLVSPRRARSGLRLDGGLSGGRGPAQHLVGGIFAERYARRRLDRFRDDVERRGRASDGTGRRSLGSNADRETVVLGAESGRMVRQDHFVLRLPRAADQHDLDHGRIRSSLGRCDLVVEFPIEASGNQRDPVRLFFRAGGILHFRVRHHVARSLDS